MLKHIKNHKRYQAEVIKTHTNEVIKNTEVEVHKNLLKAGMNKDLIFWMGTLLEEH